MAGHTNDHSYLAAMLTTADWAWLAMAGHGLAWLDIAGPDCPCCQWLFMVRDSTLIATAGPWLAMLVLVLGLSSCPLLPMTWPVWLVMAGWPWLDLAGWLTQLIMAVNGWPITWPWLANGWQITGPWLSHAYHCWTIAGHGQLDLAEQAMAGPGLLVLVDIHDLLELSGWLSLHDLAGWNWPYLDLAMFGLGWLSMTGWPWLEMAAYGWCMAGAWLAHGWSMAGPWLAHGWHIWYG